MFVDLVVDVVLADADLLGLGDLLQHGVSLSDAGQKGDDVLFAIHLLLALPASCISMTRRG